jgi:hypothetical protein
MGKVSKNSESKIQKEKEIKMNTKRICSRFPSNFKVPFLVVLALMVMLGSSPVHKVHAWSYSGYSGQVGTVIVPTIKIDDQPFAGYTQFVLWSNTGPVVYRSPASQGIQNIQAVYRVEQWNGSAWQVVVTSPVLKGQILATQSGVQMVALYLQPTVARGYFRVTWAVVWSSSTGTVLASTYIVPNLVGDHQCVTQIRLCKSYPGYFTTGLNNTTW